MTGTSRSTSARPSALAKLYRQRVSILSPFEPGCLLMVSRVSRCADASIVTGESLEAIVATVFSPAQIERFKREAKQLCRITPHLSHSAALDRIAVLNGYANWSVLHKHSDSNVKSSELQVVSITPAPFVFARTAEDMRVALRKIPETRYGYPSRTDEARAKTDDIRERFASAENAVGYAVGYVSSLLTVPRFYVFSASRANWEMRCWLPYCIHAVADDDDYAKGQILLNRRYKPVGQIMDDWAEYREHTNLHLNLSAAQITELTAKRCSLGYLYHDGSCPWHSRKHAENYLERLQVLHAMLKG